MHNLKEIRKDFPGFEKALEKRSLKIDFKKLQKLDEENRNLIQKKRPSKKKKKIFQNQKTKLYLKNTKELTFELDKLTDSTKKNKNRVGQSTI